MSKTDAAGKDGKGSVNGNGKMPHFSAVNQLDIPQGRKGKHRNMVKNILEDLAALSDGQAVRIPLKSLNGEKVQNLRSALNRVTREGKSPVATSSDENYLYVWRAETPGSKTETE